MLLDHSELATSAVANCDAGPLWYSAEGTLSARMLPLAQALVERGHTVTITAPPVHNPQDAGQRTVYAGVPVTHLDLPVLPGTTGTLQWIVTLLQQALAIRPDVLHLFKPKGYSGLTALLARITHPRLPLVVDTDDWEGQVGGMMYYPIHAWQNNSLPGKNEICAPCPGRYRCQSYTGDTSLGCRRAPGARLLSAQRYWCSITANIHSQTGACGANAAALYALLGI